MENFQMIHPVFNGSVVTLWLARPEVHNALNNFMIKEITHFFKEIEEMVDIRIVVIRGKGKSFCSGADLQWMKNAFTLNAEENLKESIALSEMFGTIFHCSKIVIATVHGNVFGGGIGLVAVCDLAYAVSDATFCLSEAKIGMAAATITPYLLQKIRSADLKELIFTARNFNSEDALRYGMINQYFTTVDTLDTHLNELIVQIAGNGNQALIASKKMINKLTTTCLAEEMKQTPRLLAQIRVSKEAQEGFSAFLEKRKPNWL